MSKTRLFSGITFNVFVLGVTSLLTDISSEMIFAYLPFYMLNVLGIEFLFIGAIEGAAETSASFFKALSGWLSDRFKRRKPFAVLGYSISAFFKPFFAFATTVLQVLVIRISDRFGKGIRTSPRDALIADSIEADVRGKAYGFHRSMDTLGAVTGPLLAFLLFPILWYTGIFLISIIPATMAVALLVAFVKERVPAEKKIDGLSFSVEFKSLSREFKIFTLVTAIFMFGNFSYVFFLYRAQNLGVPPTYAPLLYLLFQSVYALFAFPMGTLADKIGKKTVLALGYAMFGMTSLGFVLASSPIHAIMLFIPYGLFLAITETVQRAIVPDLVKLEVRGTAFGVFHATIGLVALPSSLVAGALWQFYNPIVPFTLGAIIALLSIILFLALLPAKPHVE